ncbi:MAG TPA: nucleotide sugar dehydrogenase [Streptosporangiaceae bacterium]|jgi:UDP-N-acetyl-D-mannosaminuronic acid dehydrogenase
MRALLPRRKSSQLKFLPSGRNSTVAVIGFGYVGSCIGVTLAGRGIRVSGIDSNPELVAEMTAGQCRFNDPGLARALRQARDSGRLAMSGDYATAAGCDVIIIAVGTPITADRAIVTEHLEAACATLAPHLRAGQLVVLKSTVAPGSTRGIVAPLLERSGLVAGRDFGLAFCPERLAEGNALAQFLSIPIVVGGYDPASAAAACAFWAGALGVQVQQFASPEVAELVKLTDNWWIDANIALANELAQFCGAMDADVDVLDVIAGANSLPKGTGHVNVLLPSVGVGGSCLTKDPWILWRSGSARGVQLRTAEVGRQVNDTMPAYTHGLIVDGLTALGKDPDTARVCVLGLSFKNNTNDLRSTPVLPVVQALRDSCGAVTIYDCLVTEEAAADCFGMQPAPSWQDAVQGADCVAVLAGHDEFAALDFADLAGRVSMPCLVVDGRAYYPRATIEKMRGLGFTYRGIGR